MLLGLVPAGKLTYFPQSINCNYLSNASLQLFHNGNDSLCVRGHSKQVGHVYKQDIEAQLETLPLPALSAEGQGRKNEESETRHVASKQCTLWPWTSVQWSVCNAASDVSQF